MADNLTRVQRSYCMSRVRGRDTGIERLVRTLLHNRGLRFRKHVGTLPGKPDVVFQRQKVVVFIDGDFWHGYRFPLWKASLSGFWVKKIGETRGRDRRTHRRLRRLGWTVIRLWQHEIDRNVDRCVDRVERAVRRGSLAGKPSRSGRVVACPAEKTGI